MARVDVVIPTRNNLAELRQCLLSLERQTHARLRLVVCVDGSSDGTLEYLSGLRSRFPLVVRTHPRNAHRGRAATRNLALPVLEGRFVVFVDSDMRLEAGAVERHVALLTATRCASVGTISYSNADLNLWTRYIATRRLNRFADGSTVPYSQFAAANAALDADDLRALGGFDEQIIGYGGEDSELGFRLIAKLGRSLLANHGARAISEERKSVQQALAELEGYGATNLRYLHRLHPSMHHVFHTDKLSSARVGDRLFVLLMNRATDAVAEWLLPRVPFVVQHQLLNYMVVRAVCRGYASVPLGRDGGTGRESTDSGG